MEFDTVTAADEINEHLGYDADVTDDRQYCKHGTFIGSWWGPDYMCGYCEDGTEPPPPPTFRANLCVGDRVTSSKTGYDRASVWTRPNTTAAMLRSILFEAEPAMRNVSMTLEERRGDTWTVVDRL